MSEGFVWSGRPLCQHGYQFDCEHCQPINEPTDPDERRRLRQAVFDRLITNAMESDFETAYERVAADPNFRVIVRALELYDLGLSKEEALERARADVGFPDDRSSPMDSATEDPSAKEDSE